MAKPDQEGDRDSGGARELSWMAGIATCIKVLLVPAYRSTDFEVHRNWLAITHSLPVRQWYLDETSQWTLDYPPFFAWFERFLAALAAVVDPRIVDLTAVDYASAACVGFQRATVMATDLVLYYGLWKCCREMSQGKRRLVYAAVIFSPGLLMVDHIHFQYNGFLLGILLLSISALHEGKDVLGGVIFAALVCFKHLFAVAGPVYFIYLLRHYCTGRHKLRNFLLLSASVLSVVIVAFAPFAYYDQIPQVLRRLFPFGRGLCHAYWAPNIWALYNTTDKVLSLFYKLLGIKSNFSRAAYTGGLVGDLSAHVVLPEVTPTRTIFFVLLSMLPCLYRIWREPRRSCVVSYITYAYMCGFVFGWHVHEKASLHFVIPSTLMAVDTKQAAGDYLFLSTVSYYSLFPLLYEAQEYPIKVTLLLLHVALLWTSLRRSFTTEQTKGQRLPEGSNLLTTYEAAYLACIPLVEVYGRVVHRILFHRPLPFLPLMLVSVYCSVGMLYKWFSSLRAWFFTNHSKGQNLATTALMPRLRNDGVGHKGSKLSFCLTLLGKWSIWLPNS